MTIRTVFVDLGGVLVRTEDPAPRTQLAESLGLTRRGIEKAVFENASSLQASKGEISHEEHWRNVINSLRLPASEIPRVRDAFFAGDRLDEKLVDFLRSLRTSHKTGLISNAWSDLRRWITDHHFEDAFDVMIISAETHMFKPEAGIYRLALEKVSAAPQEAVFVDDMLENVEGARSVGMHAIQFTTTEAVMEAIRNLIADHR